MAGVIYSRRAAHTMIANAGIMCRILVSIADPMTAAQSDAPGTRKISQRGAHDDSHMSGHHAECRARGSTSASALAYVDEERRLRILIDAATGARNPGKPARQAVWFSASCHWAE